MATTDQEWGMEWDKAKEWGKDRAWAPDVCT